VKDFVVAIPRLDVPKTPPTWYILDRVPHREKKLPTWLFQTTTYHFQEKTLNLAELPTTCAAMVMVPKINSVKVRILY